MVALREAERQRLGWSREIRAETISLKLGAVGQVAAADAGGKAEEIFDQRGGTGLASRRVAFQHDGLQALGRGVNRSGEARRAGAHNGEIAENFRFSLVGQGVQQARDLRHFAERGPAQGKAVALDQNRQIPLFEIQPLAKFAPLVARRNRSIDEERDSYRGNRRADVPRGNRPGPQCEIPRIRDPAAAVCGA